MRMRPRKIFCSAVALFSMGLFFSGCAQRMQSVKEDSLTDGNIAAALQSIKVSEDGYQVEISSSKKPVYTFYKSESPLKVIFDISQTEPGAITAPVEVGKEIVKNIEVSRQGVGQNMLTRVEIALAKESEFTVNPDPSDPTKLLVTFAKPQTAQAEASAEKGIEEKQLKVEDLTSPQAAVPAPTPENQAKAPAEQASNGGKQAASEDAKLEKSEPADKQTGVMPVAGVKEEQKAVTKQKAKAVTAITVVQDGIEIMTQGEVDTFHAFKLSSPSRLVLDIFAVKNGLKTKTVKLEDFGIGNARLGSSPDKVRIVFDFSGKSIPPYRVEKSDNGLHLVLKGVTQETSSKTESAVAVTPAGKKVPEPKKGPAKKVAAGPSMVEAIDFTSVEGQSRITVRTVGMCKAQKPVKSVGAWVMTIRNCQLPRRLQRMFDTSAFPTAIKDITPYQVRIKRRYDTKLLVKLRSDVPFDFKQEDGTISWSFKIPEEAEKSLPVKQLVIQQPSPETVQTLVKKDMAGVSPEKEAMKEVAKEELPTGKFLVGNTSAGLKKVYTGRRVTLEFSDADVRKIFQLIAEVSNLNFLISDDVKGTISLKLVNVPWDQALDVILESKNLEMKREGNIIQIKPRGKFKTEEQEEAELKLDRERRMELVTRVFDVNFAALADIAKQFKELSSKLPGTSIISDARTNKVIVVDNELRIKNMENLLAKLDAPEKQVMIEARIVEATSTFTRDLGIQWGIHYRDGSASIMGINQMDTGFGGILTQTPPVAGFQSFDSAGGSMGLSFGKLTSNVQLDMRLSAAATAGLVKIISTPKVVTLNNKAAKISQGQSIPYQTTSAEGTKTQFVDATLSLEVTPHITADGNIGMKITASNNSAAAAPAGVAPAINKKEATTELQVMNGETTVIGGIYVDSDTETNSGVPFLMDIPLLGWMFKSNSKSKVKTELLIFITPRVVN
jgi:type IV pilus assembly protein PilQ